VKKLLDRNKCGTNLLDRRRVLPCRCGCPASVTERTSDLLRGLEALCRLPSRGAQEGGDRDAALLRARS
jgi:hypothetical protein